MAIQSSKFDINNDGIIDAAEALKAQQARFNSYDKNSDGELTLAEVHSVVANNMSKYLSEKEISELARDTFNGLNK
ncbi:hypothetical protein [Sinobacterium caligoides]|uniref:hypothetical protein n=1 Tax=Sinobacterium caligoides TaxID=933926 RepID=UPI000F4CD366|nr:hypothetical protein [Sinobacterium caligoides]